MADLRAMVLPVDPDPAGAAHQDLRRLSLIAPAVPLCEFRLSPAHHRSFSFLSVGAAELLGLDPALLAADAAAFFARIEVDHAFRIRDGLRTSIETLAPWRDHWRYRHPRKGEVWLEADWSPRRAADGSLLWQGTLADITSHKGREQSLRKHLDRYRSMVESVPQVGWTCGPDGEDEYVSQTWLDYTGIQREGLSQADWLESIHPDDREEADAAWKRAVHNESTYRTQVRIRRVDGVYRWFDIRGTPIRDASGKLIRWFGTSHDIHDERMLRVELREAQERLAMVASVSPAVIHSFRAGPDGTPRFIYASAGIEALYGITASEILADCTRVFERIPPEDVARLRAGTVESSRLLTPCRAEFRFHHPTKGEIWIEGNTMPSRDPDGGTTWHGVLTDITGRKRMEQELKLRSDALETSLTAFGIVREGKFVYANETYLRMWGYERLEELIGTSPSGHCVDPAIPRLIIEAVERDGHCILEFEALRRDRSTFQVRMQMQATRDSEGRLTYFGTALDVTEERRSAENLRKWADAFAHCGHGIAMGDTQSNRFLACNPAFARLVGRSPKDVVGRPIIDLYAPEDHDRIKAFIARSDREGHARIETQYLRPDGLPVDVQVDLVTVHESGGAPLYRIATAQNITERKITEASLRTTRDQLQAIDRASPIPIIALTPSGTVFHWNLAAERVFGWNAEEVLGHQLPIVPIDRALEYQRFRERVVGGESFTEISQRQTRDGRRLDVQISTSPLYNAERECLGFVALYVDLTEQKTLEQALKASEERFAMAFEASPSGSILVRVSDQRIVEANQAMEKLTGYRRDQLIGRTTGELPYFVEPGTRQQLWELLNRHGRVNQLEYRFRRADGVIRQAQASAEVLQINNESIVLGVLQDVTEQREAEQALRESEARLRLFIEHAPASLAMLDTEMRYLGVSRRWLSDYGLGERNLIGLNHYEIFPEIGDRWKEIHRRALQGEIIRADTDTFERTDGSTQVLRWEVRPWQDHSGAVGGVLIFSEDITASVIAKAALGESEARFRQLAESIHEVFWLTDVAKGSIIYISPGYESIWGRSCERLYQQPRDWIDAIHPEDRDRVLEAATTRQVKGTYEEEYRIVRPDGSIRWIRDRAFPVRGSAGDVTRVAGVAEDITDRRQLESQVRQTQKMESVGLLAGGVAHDFNNWLTVISGSTELLMMEIPESQSENHELLQEIKFASERAGALTRQLLAFSRREVVEPKVMDLNVIILDTEKMLRRLLGEDVQLETSLAPGLGWVKIDPGQWTQVLMNLAVNARDAMPTGGRLIMSTRRQTLEAGFTQARSPLRPGEYVALAVTDTGCGMSPEVRSRVFEPFFTTKGMGKGTGLGLAVVHGIVTQSGGHIELESEPGGGTTFRVYLPVADEVARVNASAAGSHNLRGEETVLVVEDEESIRRVACQGLRGQGYTVLQAGDGEEALKVLERHGQAIDLLVTDVVMPKMSGRMLAEAVKAAYPGVRVLYTSGYTDDAVVRHGIQQAEVAFLSKPYTPMVLLRKIRQVLESPPPVPQSPSADRPRS